LNKPQEQVSLKRRFFNLRTLISFSLAIAFLLFIIFRLDIDLAASWQRIKESNLLLYTLAFVIYYLTFPLRGWRWHVLLKNSGINPPSPLRLSPLIFLSFFTNCILYGRIGDAYRAYLLKEERQSDFPKALGTILAERAMDATIIFLLLFLAAIGLWGRGDFGPILLAGFGVVLIFALALGVIRGLGTALVRLLPSRFRSLFVSFQEGALSFRHLPLLSFQGLLIWLLEGGRVLLVAKALGIGASPLLFLFVAQATGFLSAIPLTPGGLGLVEPGVAGLLMITLSREEAWSIALVDRTISYLSLILFGALLLLIKELRGGRL
jgi:hypothetical protein